MIEEFKIVLTTIGRTNLRARPNCKTNDFSKDHQDTTVAPKSVEQELSLNHKERRGWF